MAPLRQLLINGEDFQCERHLKRLIEKCVDVSTKDFNFDKIPAENKKVDALIDLMNTTPMMADRRTVIVQDFEEFNKEALEKLAGYFKKPAEQTDVILLAQKIDKRTAFYKAFQKCGEIIEFKPLYDNKLPEFVASEAKLLGVFLEPGAAELLAELVGNNLMSLVSEIEKLGLYVGTKSVVTRSHISELIGRGLVNNVFVIGNLIGTKKIAPLMETYNQLVQQGEAPARLLGLVVTHFRRLLLAQSFAEKTRGQFAPADIASLLGVHPFFAKDYVTQTKLFKSEKLKHLYRDLMKVSTDLRSSRVKDTTLVESFFQRACLG